MRASIRTGDGSWSHLREHLLGSEQERMAYLLARATRWADHSGSPVLDLLVTRVVLVPDSGLSHQSAVSVVPEASVTRELLIACYETGLSLIDVHSHPFATDHVSFSGHDVANMRETHRDFLMRMPADPPIGVASLVLGRESVAGAFTDPRSGALLPLHSLTVLGEHLQAVTLCQN
ncbi:hypothetical protein M8C13_05040 [Crossiella sp. SN42]|uniref:hypothetical protein n=1 Tax=Crossiella sp. SN42 TaxID=2944808 RepID=UPI00207C6B30|nr:hypothetical protein [Crossiella sp. SN42]MCO1575123.1 hypothetical protein [Crossiella sp. SN42]